MAQSSQNIKHLKFVNAHSVFGTNNKVNGHHYYIGGFYKDNAWWSTSHILPLCVLWERANFVYTCNQTQGQYL